MTKENRDNIIVQIASISAFVAVLLGTVGIYLYSNGWRLDPFKQEIIKTGVLTVESQPTNGTLYAEGEAKGRTPKSLSLPIGTYDISVEKEGYITWNKKVKVKEEKSTPTFPWLIKEEFTTENIFTLEDATYMNSWINETEDHIYILTQTTNTDKTNTYTIYQYDINKPFWDLTSNPKETFKYNSELPVIIDLNISPSGRNAILALTTEEKTTQYIWEINRTNNIADMTKVDLTAFNTYTSTWTKDNENIIFESENEIISFDIEKQTKYLLKKKTQDTDYKWITDNQGNIYFFTYTQDEEKHPDHYKYTLTQTLLDGSNPKNIIENLYMRKESTYLKEYTNNYIPYKNSIECAQSVGLIDEFQVNNTAEGIYISTPEASYWYDMNTDMFTLISASPTQFINFSYDNKKILIQDPMGYAIFTFEKDLGDHTVNIGKKYISNTQQATNIKWLSNSTNLSLKIEDTLYIIDKDGDNLTELIDTSNNKYTGLNYGKDQIYTVEITDEKISINHIDIH